MKQFSPIALPLITALFLTACGATSQSPDFQPLRPDPTSTPTVETVVSPTPVVSAEVAVQLYTHTSGRFSLNYPANWELVEQPNGVLLVEPGDHAGYSVLFQDIEQTYTPEELNQFLVTYVAQNFAGEGSDFSAISQETRADGTVIAQFSTLDPNRGRVVNEVRVQQRDTLVFITLINATQEQWDVSQQKLQHLADTLTVLDSSPVVVGTPTRPAPVWILIGSTSNRFGFLYPSDWTVVRQDEAVVQVTMPDLEMSFEGSVSDNAPAGSTPVEQARQAVQQFVDDLSVEYTGVQSLPPTEFPLGQTTGATVDFLYTTPAGKNMAGSIIAAVNEGKLYRVIFIAPAEYYQAALQWFNPMYKSFKILLPDELPPQ